MIVRKGLHALGYRYRLCRRDLPGKPDLVLPKYRTVIFVHGCFWHSHEGCSRATKPESNKEYWAAKLAGNRERDARAKAELHQLGWRVLVVWECACRKTLEPRLMQLIENFLAGTAQMGEIGGSDAGEMSAR